MLLNYDPETDMLYIGLRGGPSVESEEIAPGFVLDFDTEGNVVGIEIEDASRKVELERLELLTPTLAGSSGDPPDCGSGQEVRAGNPRESRNLWLTSDIGSPVWT